MAIKRVVQCGCAIHEARLFSQDLAFQVDFYRKREYVLILSICAYFEETWSCCQHKAGMGEAKLLTGMSV